MACSPVVGEFEIDFVCIDVLLLVILVSKSMNLKLTKCVKNFYVHSPQSPVPKLLIVNL